jgi:thiamine-phosphate pyrophosphorylase
VQIREKDLPARELYEVARTARALPNARAVKLLVNTRVDVALAAGLDGVHFPAGSPDAGLWRGIVPGGFLLGVSCHTVEEAVAAAAAGASYVTLAPVFAPRSKAASPPPLGLEALALAVRRTSIPVLALGGITEHSAAACAAAGAAGIAGISLFQTPSDAC